MSVRLVCVVTLRLSAESAHSDHANDMQNAEPDGRWLCQGSHTCEQRKEQVLQLPLHAVHVDVLPGGQQPRTPGIALQRAQHGVRAAHQQV